MWLHQIIIYGSRASSNSTDQFSCPQLDSGNRRRIVEGLISHQEAEILKALLVNTVTFYAGLYTLILLFMLYSSVSGISLKITLGPLSFLHLSLRIQQSSALLSNSSIISLIASIILSTDPQKLVLLLLHSSRESGLPLKTTHGSLSLAHRSSWNHHSSFFSSALSLIPFIAPHWFDPLCESMADQHHPPAEQAQPSNFYDNLFNNKECTMCKAHTIMINSLTKQLKELQDDYHSDRNSKRRKLDKRKNEIEALQERCSHLEAAMEHIRSLTQSYQAEASTKASVRNPDDSVTQHFP